MSEEVPEGKNIYMRLTVSPRLYAYLTYLKNHTMLGGSENEVAVAVLTQRLTEMRFGNYKEPAFPDSD